MVEECAATRLRPRDRIAGAARDLVPQARNPRHRRRRDRRGGRHQQDDALPSLRLEGRSDHSMPARCRASRRTRGGPRSRRSIPAIRLAQLRAWVRGGAECVCDDDRGCDLANAAVELAETDHPARRVIEADQDRTARSSREIVPERGDRAGRSARRHFVAVCSKAPASAGRASAPRARARNSCACARPIIASFRAESLLPRLAREKGRPTARTLASRSRRGLTVQALLTNPLWSTSPASMKATTPGPRL